MSGPRTEHKCGGLHLGFSLLLEPLFIGQDRNGSHVMFNKKVTRSNCLWMLRVEVVQLTLAQHQLTSFVLFLQLLHPFLQVLDVPLSAWTAFGSGLRFKIMQSNGFSI